MCRPFRANAPLVVLLVLVGAGCAAPPRLAEADLGGRTVAVIAVTPPEDLVRGPWPLADPRALPPGRVRERHEAARRAQGRLTAAARQTDVADLVARHALARGAPALGLRAVPEPRAADLVLDVRVLAFDLRARTFTAPVVLDAEVDVVLVERATEEVLWRRRVRERLPVPAEVFGLEGRRLSAAALAERSEAEMAEGLARLAARVGERVAEWLARAR